MKVTTAEAAQAIKKAKGFITIAAKNLGISRSQLHNLINAHPTVKAALTDAREEMKDFAEGKLFANIQEGKEASIFFYLKCQAKDRGYVERQELEHGGQVTLRVVYDDDQRNDNPPSEAPPETA